MVIELHRLYNYSLGLMRVDNWSGLQVADLQTEVWARNETSQAQKYVFVIVSFMGSL